MTRSELIIQLVKANPHLSHERITKLLKVIFDMIGKGLAEGRRVELRGFGVFYTKWRPPRERRNPRTGKQVAVAGSYNLFFRPGKELRKKLNQRPPINSFSP